VACSKAAVVFEFTCSALACTALILELLAFSDSTKTLVKLSSTGLASVNCLEVFSMSFGKVAKVELIVPTVSVNVCIDSGTPVVAVCVKPSILLDIFESIC